MKKLLFILAFFAAFASQAQVKVLGYVVPNATSDQYPTHVDIYGQGGFQSVNSVVERNAITPLRRKKGMLVYVADSVKVYQLGNDLTSWTVFNSGGGGLSGSGEIDPVFIAHVAHTITQNNINFWNRIALLPLYSTTDSMLSKIDSAARAHDYTFDPNWFTVTGRFISFNNQYVESDPIFQQHVASSITQNDIDRWNAGLDTASIFDKVKGLISDSLNAHKYYVDGNTIRGDGTISDPFHVVPFGDTSYYNPTNNYTKNQVDSAIAANFHQYDAGYGLLLQNSTFSVDTTKILNKSSLDRIIQTFTNIVNSSTSSDTAVQDILQKNGNTFTVVKKNSTKDIVIAGQFVDTYTKAQVDSAIAANAGSGGGGGITTEQDPIFTAHVASSITQTDINRWNAFASDTSSNGIFADGITILGTGSITDPLRAAGYSKTQIDSLVASKFHEYGAGYGLVLENATFRLDTTALKSGGFIGNGGGGSGSVTSVAATGTSGVIASVANPTTTPAISIRADTSFLSTKSYTNNLVNTVVNNFGDSINSVKNTIASSVSKVLPYNADSSFYLGGDTSLHRLPVAPATSDSIDYAFTAMTTVYNEAGPGEYSVSPNGLTANKDNFTAPFRQLKSLDIGTWTDGDYISFTNATISSSTNFTFLRAFIRLKSVVPVSGTISFAFYYNGTQVSKTISCVNYGIDKNKVGVYQNVSIPFSAFGFTSNNFDELRLKFGGTQSDGIYMDLVQFQNASVFENTFITDVFKKPLTDSVFKVVGGINVFAYRDSAGGGSVSSSPYHLPYNGNTGYYLGGDSTLHLLPTSSSGTVTGGSIAWPGAIYATPTTATVNSGVLTFSPTLSSQTANTVFAGPTSGSAAVPSFRQLAASDIAVSKQSYTSGTTVTVSDAVSWLVVNPSATVSALSITTPANPYDAQRVEISFGGTLTSGNVVTALTVVPNTGQTILQNTSPTSVAAGETIIYRYNASNTKWYRIQ